MSVVEIFSYGFGALALFFSFWVILARNPITSAFSLVAVFFCVSALFALMSAHFLAGLQILVYAGAIMVLFVFVIMLLNADLSKMVLEKKPGFAGFCAGLCAVMLAVFIWSIHHGVVSDKKAGLTVEKIEQLGGNVRAVSTLLFSDYVLPFEVTSILLLVGIVGSVALAKRKLDSK